MYDEGFDEYEIEEPRNEWIDDVVSINERYLDTTIPVFIEISGSNVVVNFYLQNLDPRILQSIHIDPEQELSMVIKRTNGRIAVENIYNAGMLECSLREISRGNLRNIVEETLLRLNNPGRYCIVCQRELEGSRVRPTSCTNELCQFRSNEFIDLNVSLSTEPEVISLLSAFFNSALNSSVFSNINHPFQSVARIDNVAMSRVNPFPERFTGTFKEKRQRAIDLLAKFPDLSKTSERELVQIDSDLPYLIRWIITSCRSSIKLSSRDELPEELKDVLGEYFFEIIDTPEQNEIFESRKAQSGTVYGYYGSSADKWYSTIHNCLPKDPAFNGGIGLNPKVNTALQQSSIGLQLPGSLFDGFKVYLIAEMIVNDMRTQGGGLYYIVPDNSDISIKYIVLTK